ncbi:MAG TPA: LysM peptidoglycan-binding domain-containing protein, partial [Chondromyces sp.]|nr:LysM peptidoglycan-binding domain-containing protein [Chondromyces sp.]
PEKDTISELEQNVTTESTVPEIVLRAEEKESEPVLEEEKLDTQVQVEEEQEEEVSKLEVIKAEEEHLEESSSSIEEIKEKTNKWKKGKKYESISLTDFFARKEEENAARLRVCIVQKGETIDTLAERYRLNAQQIIKVNQLETTQDVYEGQVLYIPVSVPAEK